MRWGSRFWGWVCLSAALAFAPEGFAYRPFTTEDASVAGRGVAQSEASWDYLKWDNHDREQTFLWVPIYGLTDRVELSAEIPYHDHDPKGSAPQDGLGDINLVGKVLWREEADPWPALAFKAAVKTSTGNEDRSLGSGDRDLSLVGVASKRWGQTQWHGMLGFTFVGGNGQPDRRNITLFGVGVDQPLARGLHLVAEVSGNRHPDRNADDDPAFGMAGFLYEISSKTWLDSGIKFGLNNAAPKWNTTVGVTVSF